MTYNFVLLVFQAVDSAELGDMKKRATRSGRVLGSVTRSNFDPNVGSVNWNPAPPIEGRGGSTRSTRSARALYVSGGVCAAEGRLEIRTSPTAMSHVSRICRLNTPMMTSISITAAAREPARSSALWSWQRADCTNEKRG